MSNWGLACAEPGAATMVAQAPVIGSWPTTAAGV
jgi:hypothetical protein